MSDLDRLRAALREPPPTDFAPVDLTAVMAAGGRIRRRRQVRIIGGAVTAVAAAAVIAVAGVHQLRPTESSPIGAQPSVTRPPTTSATTTATASTPPAGPARWGDVIRTGSVDDTGELVFYFTRIDGPAGDLSLRAGRRAPNGDITEYFSTNETTGSDRSEGFHAASVATDYGNVPVCGYYVGAPARISAVIGGVKTTAHQAVWGSDPTITVWWFDYSADEPSDLAAFDAGGGRMPAGNTAFGRG